LGYLLGKKLRGNPLIEYLLKGYPYGGKKK